MLPDVLYIAVEFDQGLPVLHLCLSVAAAIAGVFVEFSGRYTAVAAIRRYIRRHTYLVPILFLPAASLVVCRAAKA